MPTLKSFAIGCLVLGMACLAVVIAPGTFVSLYSSDFNVSYVIPDYSEYPNDIKFSGSPYEIYGPRSKRPALSYRMVKWNIKPETANQNKCPITVEIDGQVLKTDDFQFDAFLKLGALDSRVETAKSLGTPVDETRPPILTLRSQESNTTITCHYNVDKSLYSVELLISYEWKGKRSVKLPQKDVRITIAQGTVSIPTDHKTLVRQLGDPVKHVPAHTQKADRIP